MTAPRGLAVEAGLTVPDGADVTAEEVSDGVRFTFAFLNGYGVSVIRHGGGTPAGLFGVTVIGEGEDATHDSGRRGQLSGRRGVDAVLRLVAGLPRRDNNTPCSSST